MTEIELLHEEIYELTCPICDIKMGYTPGSNWSIRECPSGHYHAHNYHYGAEYTVNGKIFYFDDCGYENPQKELEQAITQARLEFYKGK